MVLHYSDCACARAWRKRKWEGGGTYPLRWLDQNARRVQVRLVQVLGGMCGASSVLVPNEPDLATASVPVVSRGVLYSTDSHGTTVRERGGTKLVPQ